MSRIVPSLWFPEKVEEAVGFYVSLLPDSRVDSVWTLPVDSPSGPAGSVIVMEFTLAGSAYTAMQAGKMDPFNHAVSFTILCDEQAEVDRLWAALAEGGATEACGWLRDRYGVSWQIVPRRLYELMRDPDRARAARVATAMMGMVKLDIAGLERAAAG